MTSYGAAAWAVLLTVWLGWQAGLAFVALCLAVDGPREGHPPDASAGAREAAGASARESGLESPPTGGR